MIVCSKCDCYSVVIRYKGQNEEQMTTFHRMKKNSDWDDHDIAQRQLVVVLSF